MSYPEFFPFTAPQEATIVPADLAFFDHQLQYPAAHDDAIDQFSQTIVDPGVGFASMSGVDVTAWSWPDSLNLTQTQPLLQQNCSQTQTVLDAGTGAISTTLLDPLAQAFEQHNTVDQPAVQDGWTTSESQARPDEYGTIEKMEELMAMVLDLRAQTDQRMNRIEEEIRAVKSR